MATYYVCMHSSAIYFFKNFIYLFSDFKSSINTIIFILLLFISFILILITPISNKILLLQIPYNIIYLIIILLISSLLIIISGIINNSKIGLLSSIRHFGVLYSYSLTIIMIFFVVGFINNSLSILNLKITIINGSIL